MNDYEITYISSPQLAEDARGQLDAAIDNKITEEGGISEFASPSLRRRLAYPINKNANGFLRTLQIQLDPAKLAAIHEYLKKELNIIRFAILKTTRRADVPAEIIEKHVPKKTPQNKKGEKNNRHGAVTRKPKSTPAKSVTMEDVEKGIEEALTEEVK